MDEDLYGLDDVLPIIPPPLLYEEDLIEQVYIRRIPYTIEELINELSNIPQDDMGPIPNAVLCLAKEIQELKKRM